MEDNLATLQKLNREPPYDPPIPLLGTLTRKNAKPRLRLIPVPQQRPESQELKGRNNPNVYQGMKKVKVLKCESLGSVWLCHPLDCSSLGSSVHGILEARILEWIAISFSRDPRIEPGSPPLQTDPLPSAPWGKPSGWRGKWNVVYPYSGTLFSYKKEQNSDTCHNMDEPWKHDKWNELDTKGQILYNSTYMKYLE